MEYKLATILGRHPMPIEDAFFFNQVDNVTDVDFLNERINEKLDELKVKADDKLVVYVSGLTVVTTAIIAECAQRHIHVTLMHFDASAKDYYAQVIF